MDQFYGGIFTAVFGILLIVFKNFVAKIPMRGSNSRLSPNQSVWIGIFCIGAGLIFFLLAVNGIILTH